MNKVAIIYLARKFAWGVTVLRQFKAEYTGRADNEHRIGSEKIESKDEVVRAHGKNIKQDDHLMSCNVQYTSL